MKGEYMKKLMSLNKDPLYKKMISQELSKVLKILSKTNVKTKE
jgi:hypothetical protein